MEPSAKRLAAGCRAVVGALAISALLGACASTGISGKSARPSQKSAVASAQVLQSASPGVCSSGQLTVNMSSLGGAAGSRYYQLRFTNSSSRACTLTGYSGVSFVSSNGDQVGAAAQREASSYSPVLIEPSTATYEMLRQVNAEDYPPASCQTVPVRGVRVYAPEQTASTVLPLAGQGCQSKSVELLYVWPVRSSAASS